MKRKICLLLIGILFLCSGCTVNYTLSINEDLTVSESLNAMEGADFYSAYTNSSVQKVIGFILEPNLDYLNSNGYTVDQVLTSSEAGVKVTNEYANLEEYKTKSQLPNQFADDWTYIENGNEITLTITGAFSHDEQNQDGKYVVDEATINIVLPFKVVNHNADSFDEDTNTYTWNFNEDTEEREITITFNKTIEKPFNSIYIIIGIGIVVVLIIFLIISKFMDTHKDRNKIE